MDDRDRALSALHTLDPGCSREQWHEIGRAAIAAGLTVEDINRWSSTASNYAGARDVKAAFRTVTPEGGTGPGTLYKQAFAAGWNDPSKSDTITPRKASKTKPASAKKSDAMALWERCQPATEAHPYIIAKRGTPDGLRIVPSDRPPTIAGKNVAGWLVVPAWSLLGELRTLQLVPPPGIGKKLNMPGAAFDDGLFVVGDLAHSPRVFIVEGIGQAWACWAATGHAAAVTFGAGRFKAVAEVLHQHSASVTLVFVPDRGKENQAAELARAVSGEWVELPQDKPTNYDANDYAAEYGADELDDLLSRTKKPPQRFHLLTATELSNLPGIRWRVRGVIPAEGIGAIYGASSSGKSFLALDMLAAIARGGEWFSYRVKHAPVVYVALEGEAGISNRVQAYQSERGPLPDAFRFLLTALDIRDGTDRAELVKAIKATGQAGGVLVLDTLNRAAPGMDENDSRDMGQVISAVKAVQAELSGLVLLVHHTGKDGTKGMRGHSSLHAALDIAIEVRRDGDSREWLIAKAKDGMDGNGHPFRLDVVEIGTDDESEAITSCIVTPTEATPSELKRQKIPATGNQRIAWNVLGELLRKAGDVRSKDAPDSLPQGRPAVTVDMAVDAILDRLSDTTDIDPKRRKERAKKALTDLHAKAVIRIEAGFVWCP